LAAAAAGFPAALEEADSGVVVAAEEEDFPEAAVALGEAAPAAAGTDER
jgi:hypothetical protein